MRSQVRAKRRKTNLILNGLIGVVILLIIFVSVSIFSNDDQKDKKQEESVENSVNQNENVNSSNKTVETSKQDEDSTDDAVEEEKEDEESPVITEGGGNNVKQTIMNPAWEPVGTTQTGPYTSDSDWDERVQALAYAIGIDKENMTVWYLSRDGSSEGSIGTVTAKGDPQAYRVYLEWEDGGGWKPVKVEELIENDKGKQSED